MPEPKNAIFKAKSVHLTYPLKSSKMITPAIVWFKSRYKLDTVILAKEKYAKPVKGYRYHVHCYLAGQYNIWWKHRELDQVFGVHGNYQAIRKTPNQVMWYVTKSHKWEWIHSTVEDRTAIREAHAWHCKHGPFCLFKKEMDEDQEEDEQTASENDGEHWVENSEGVIVLQAERNEVKK